MLELIKKLFGKNNTDFAALVKQGAIIIDVRTVGEFRDGHIKGSRNIPLDSIKSKLGEIKKLQKPIITVCRSGTRSSMAKSIMVSNGLEVYNGGAWNSLERKL
jgi:phage shock protein E